MSYNVVRISWDVVGCTPPSLIMMRECVKCSPFIFVENLIWEIFPTKTKDECYWYNKTNIVEIALWKTGSQIVPALSMNYCIVHSVASVQVFDVFSKHLMARHPSVPSLFTAFVTRHKATAASEKMAAFHGNPAKFIVSRNFLPFARNVNQSFWSAGKLDQATPVLQLLREVGLFLWQANAINGVSNRKRSEDNYFRSD